MSIPADGMIETAYPNLTRHPEVLVRFTCNTCGVINSSNEFVDAEDVVYQVCANCFSLVE